MRRSLRPVDALDGRASLAPGRRRRRLTGLVAASLAAPLAMAGLGLGLAVATASAAQSQVLYVANGGGGGMSNINCDTASYCVATDYAHEVDPFINGQLTEQPALPSGDDMGVYDVACPSVGTCFGVGTTEGPPPYYTDGAIFPISNGVIGAPVADSDAALLSGIACYAGTTNCVAVGSASSTAGAVVSISDGVPTGVTHTVPNSGPLTTVACPAVGTCFAGGSAGLMTGTVVPITSGNPGIVQDVAGVSAVSSIACESATDCWAAAGADALQITDGTAGTPQAVSSVTKLLGASCPTVTQCYLAGTEDPDGVELDGTGAVVPITGDSVGAAQLNPAVQTFDALACVSTTECIGAGTVVTPNEGYDGALVLDAIPLPDPTISSVEFIGKGTGVQIVVSGSGFGDWDPLPDPAVPLTCVRDDPSYDFDPGVLGFTDVTSGWSAGTPGSCIGLTIDSWSDSELILGLGSGYVYPKLNPDDSYQVTVNGTTYSGTAIVAAPLVPVVTDLSFVASKGNIHATVTGTNFGSRIPLGTGPLNCASEDKSQDFLSDAISFSDLTTGWTAGEVDNCLGLVISKWSNTKIDFSFGAYYSQVTGLASGDAYQFDLLGTINTGTATVSGLPTITSVSFTGTGTALTATVTGTALGSKPQSGEAADCTSTSTGVDFAPSGFTFADTTAGWNAGGYGNCTGAVIKSWTSTSVRFQFGNQYAVDGIVSPGDAYSLTLNGTTYSSAASLPDAAVVDSVAFTQSGSTLTVHVSGSDFGAKPSGESGTNCGSGPVADFAPNVLSFADDSAGWGAGSFGDCIGLTVTAWTSTSIAFHLNYSGYQAVASGDTYQLVVMGTTYQSTVSGSL